MGSVGRGRGKRKRSLGKVQVLRRVGAPTRAEGDNADARSSHPRRPSWPEIPTATATPMRHAGTCARAARATRRCRRRPAAPAHAARQRPPSES